MAFIVPRGSKVCVPPLLLSVLPVLRHVVYSNTFSKKVVCEANRFPFTSPLPVAIFQELLDYCSMGDRLALLYLW